ncbi:PREDICTED: HLA class II histocompatibility antigen, DRB1-15 beta chain-like [Nanorana parkeri]|uniref:HLA class II histocompatibility antigen, DRB1-15 beta chain-like n=1 Tax=Nanorana parkeri TaxID=125878 RepID=UPI000854DB0F|nr:PREDICTED: HLA class II histocompatibility antigen, DRB1-15 beta chain-like [Nanorana parkeri]
MKSECHFRNGTQRVKFLDRYFYNQEESVYFDSDVGDFIAKTEFGRPDAEYWNKDKDFIEQTRAAVQTFCVHNYGVLHSVTADRRVKPAVKVSLMPDYEDSHSEHHMLVCNVHGFYPSKIAVKWYRNSQEEKSQVQSTNIFQNGDWTFQVLVMLETEIKKGDNFSCEVYHSSLGAPIRVDWQPQMSDSATNKVVTGVVGFVLGSVLIIAGVVVYMRGRKAQMTFRGPQTEHFIHS